MIIRCPSCTTGFEIPDHVLGDGRKVRCNQCQHVWFADASSPATATAPASDVTPTAPASTSKSSEPAPAPAASENAQAAPIPAPTFETSKDQGKDQDEDQDATADTSDDDTVDDVEGDENEDASPQDDASDHGDAQDEELDEDQDQDQDEDQEQGSLAATLAAMREEAENEDLDDHDEDDDYSLDGDHGLNIGGAVGAMPRAVLIGWISLPIFFILVIGLFFGLHGSISQAWPPSNQIYGVFGLASDGSSQPSSGGKEDANEDHDIRNDPGYDPKDYISMDYSAQPSELADGTPALLIRGTITNSAEFDIELAPMRAVLRNRLNQNVHQWDFDLADSHVRAGGVLPFTTSVADPPRDMTGLEIFLLWPPK